MPSTEQLHAEIVERTGVVLTQTDLARDAAKTGLEALRVIWPWDQDHIAPHDQIKLKKALQSLEKAYTALTGALADERFLEDDDGA